MSAINKFFNKKLLLLILCLGLLSLTFFTSQQSLAQTTKNINWNNCKSTDNPLDCYKNNLPANQYGRAEVGLEPSDIAEIIGQIIYYSLSFVGLILFIIFFYSGYLWLTSGSSSDDRKNALKYIKNAIIGLAITFTAFGLTYFVLNRFSNLQEATPDTIYGGFYSCNNLEQEKCNQAGCLWQNNKCQIPADCLSGANCSACKPSDCPTDKCSLIDNACQDKANQE